MTADRPEPPASVAVLGAGTMGPGIALAFAVAGSSVCLFSRSWETLDRARRRIDASLAFFGHTGSVGPADAAAASERIVPTTDLDAIDPHTDLVIESIVEEVEPKQAILRAVESRASPDTVLCTDTSSIPLTELAGALGTPERFLGYHWFNPAELVALVEVVPVSATLESMAGRVVAWSVAIGKEPVLLVRDVEGFVANRLQYALMREAYMLVEQGVCGFDDVDRVMRAGLGPRWAAVGPFESMDLAGLDVHHAVARRLFPTLSARTDVPPALAALIEGGALGVKSGRGLGGSYDPESARRLGDRRDRVLLALNSLRGGD